MQDRIRDIWGAFWSDDSGQSLTEYALIIALVAVGLMLVLTAFRDAIGGVFDDMTTELNNASVNQYQPGGTTSP